MLCRVAGVYQTIQVKSREGRNNFGGAGFQAGSGMRGFRGERIDRHHRATPLVRMGLAGKPSSVAQRRYGYNHTDKTSAAPLCRQGMRGYPYNERGKGMGYGLILDRLTSERLI